MDLQSLDFHKLRHFWHTARHGSLAAAARALGVAQPTVSTQVQALEDQLDGLLFDRRGRRLELTARGKIVFRYADQIFELGAELTREIATGLADSPGELLVGVADGVPKAVVRSILEPAFSSGADVRLECREWRTDLLIAELSQHRMDMVVADAPGPGATASRLLSYEAGRSGIVLLAAPPLASRARRGFPRGLSGMPFLVPVRESPLRRGLDTWFDANNVLPRIVAETDDRALLNHLAQAGLGIIPAALTLERELRRQYQVARVGILRGLRERYFVLTTPRRLRHPGVAAVCKRARQRFTALVASGGEPMT